MDLTVSIPDEIVPRLQAAGSDLPRRALEAFGLEEYKNGHITSAELRRMLGFSTRYELDGFLKDHGVLYEYTLEDFEREREGLRRLGF